MNCHICGDEAVGRCFACGNLFCHRHGTEDCERCETAIAPGDRRGDRISQRPLPPRARFGWWRPIPAEDFEPPGCYLCQGLTRQTCRNCQQRFCPEHAGYPGMCQPCSRSARLGLYVLFAALAVIGGLISLSLLF